MFKQLLSKKLFLILTVLAASYYFLTMNTIQVLASPIRTDYQVNMSGANWICTPNTSDLTQYFREKFVITQQPASAYILIDVVQTSKIYVNGIKVAQQNSSKRQRIGLFDITPTLTIGTNLLAVEDQFNSSNSPTFRAKVVINYAFGSQQIINTDSSWLTSPDTESATQQGVGSNKAVWYGAGFNDSTWINSKICSSPQASDAVQVFPWAFEAPMQGQWIIPGSVSPNTEDAYYMKQYRFMPLSQHNVWVRVSVPLNTTFSLYINGELVSTQRMKLNRTFIYDVTNFVHSGQMTIAIHTNWANLPGSSPVNLGAITSSDLLESASQPNLIPGSNNGVVSAPNLQPQTSDTLPAGSVLFDGYSENWTGQITTLKSDQTWQATYTASRQFPDNLCQSCSHTPTSLINTTISGSNVPLKVQGHLKQYTSTVYGFIIEYGTALFLIAITLFPAYYLVKKHKMNWLNSLGLSAVPMAFAAIIGQLVLLLNRESALPEPVITPAIYVISSLLIIIIVSMIIFNPNYYSKLTNAIARLNNWFIRVWNFSLLNKLKWPKLSLAQIYLILFVGIMAFAATYQMSNEPYWQDELTSLFLAQGILHGGIPAWPTGFILLKGELYNYILAAQIAIFGDGPISTRLPSVIEYLLGILALYKLGKDLFGKKIAILACTADALSPLALAWIQEVRYYEQVHLFAIIFAYLFYKAINSDSKRYIYLSMLVLLATYLSHEASIIIFPGVLVYFLASKRFRWLKNEHWPLAWILLGSAIAIQLILVKVTGIPVLNIDNSTRPSIGLSLDNPWFYLNSIFHKSPYTFINYLAILGIVVSFFKKDRGLRYIAWLFVSSLICVSLILMYKEQRYIYVIFPFYYLLASYGAAEIVYLVRSLLASLAKGINISPQMVGSVSTVFAVCLGLLVLVSQDLPISSTLSPAIANLLGQPLRKTTADYDVSGQYIFSHLQQGDIVAAVIPPEEAYFYTGQSPYYFAHPGIGLYYYEKNGAPHENVTGSIALDDTAQIEALLNTPHKHIWLYSDQSKYFNRLSPQVRAFIATHFVEVYEGGSTNVYYSV